MTPSRAASASLTALLLAVALTGCGSSGADLPSASQARTAACRGYELTVGDTDLAAGKNAMAQTGTGPDIEGIRASLAPVRVAAVSAGTTTGLGANDFALFRAVVRTVDVISEGGTVLDDGSTILSTASVAKFQAAADAVHKTCY
ncbi:MAG TPA: hypothetical protein VFE07_11260 [Marmoricola sp.]|jgi:hypothetical protein|nr:hypothetical protein [Marmoricola sp.]